MWQLRRLAWVCVIGLASTSAYGQGADAALKDRVVAARRAARRPEGRGAEAAEEALIKLGARSCRSCPRRRSSTGRRAKERLERVRAAIAEKTEQDEPRRLAGHDQGPGDPPDRGDPAAPDRRPGNPITDLREQDGRGGDQPVARPRHRRHAVLRGPRPDRQEGRGHAQLLHRRRLDRPDGGRRWTPRDQIGAGPADDRSMYTGPFRIALQADRRCAATSRPAPPRPTPSSRWPGSPGSGRCSWR